MDSSHRLNTSPASISGNRQPLQNRFASARLPTVGTLQNKSERLPDTDVALYSFKAVTDVPKSIARKCVDLALLPVERAHRADNLTPLTRLRWLTSTTMLHGA